MNALVNSKPNNATTTSGIKTNNNNNNSSRQSFEPLRKSKLDELSIEDIFEVKLEFLIFKFHSKERALLKESHT